MKNLFKLLLLFVSFFIFSCENEEQTLLNENLVVQKAFGGDCPPGTYLTSVYEFSEFRFHRPKMGCESGFWFCTTDGGWTKMCRDGDGRLTQPIKDIQMQSKVYAIPNDDDIVKFVFPMKIIDLSGKGKENFEEFNVDEELVFGNLKLITGTYLSIFVEDAIVIDVPAKKI